MDQLNDLQAMIAGGETQPQILNHNLIFPACDKLFRFFQVMGCVYFISALGKVFAQGKADRLFVINNQQMRSLRVISEFIFSAQKAGQSARDLL